MGSTEIDLNDRTGPTVVRFEYPCPDCGWILNDSLDMLCVAITDYILIHNAFCKNCYNHKKKPIVIWVKDIVKQSIRNIAQWGHNKY